ncbi:DUF4126 domain-containing protein [Homoserinimonas sp. A520]
MLEFLTGAGLALAAGVNAYIPLLAIGLASRFLEFVQLPDAWQWLENEWVLGILVALLVIEFFADKIPIVDSVNDWVQTVIRPAAGGLAFGSGSTTETLTVQDPAAFFESNQWVPIAVGALLALAVHVVKMISRPVLNAVTAGAAAPVVSVAEDIGSLFVSALAILLPILVIVSVPLLAWWAWTAVSRARKRAYRS